MDVTELTDPRLTSLPRAYLASRLPLADDADRQRSLRRPDAETAERSSLSAHETRALEQTYLGSATAQD